MRRNAWKQTVVAADLTQQIVHAVHVLTQLSVLYMISSVIECSV